jgi:aminobenzoyl-glutamate transport protein
MSDASRSQRGFLGFVERAGNLLPEPTMIFVWLILFLMLLSALGQALGWEASLNYTGETAPQWGVLKDGVLTYAATSLFSEENFSRLLTEMPKTLTGFAPLGLVLTLILGAAVAERSGRRSSLCSAWSHTMRQMRHMLFLFRSLRSFTRPWGDTRLQG